jgi:hypothetical protein
VADKTKPKEQASVTKDMNPPLKKAKKTPMRLRDKKLLQKNAGRHLTCKDRHATDSRYASRHARDIQKQTSSHKPYR